MHQPPPSHVRRIRYELLSNLSLDSAVQMASMDDFADLLQKYGQKLELNVVTAVEMRRIRVKSAAHIFKQLKKGGEVDKDNVFDESLVEFDEINMKGRYYGGFIFTPSTASHMCRTGKNTCEADAAHCKGVGIQSYARTFVVVGYDGSNCLSPIVFSHYIGDECKE